MSAPAVRHSCPFCIELQRAAIRQRDLALIEAAEQLSAAHVTADAQREAFTTRLWAGPQTKQSRCY